MSVARRLLPVLVALVVLLQVSACASAHYSLESAFENPATLIRVGEDQMLYVSATLTGRSQLLTYVEYDPGAQGYGALAVRTGDLAPGRFAIGSASGGPDVTTWSYIGARRLGQLGLGFAVNQATGTAGGCTIDTGLSFDFKALTVSFACRQMEFGPDGLAAQGDTVSGLELRISDSLSLGLDVASSPVPEYRLSVAAGSGLVNAWFYVMGEQDTPLDSGLQVGLRYDSITVKLGYHIDRLGDRQIAALSLAYMF